MIRSCYEINYTDCAGWFFEIKEENAAVPGYGEAFCYYSINTTQLQIPGIGSSESVIDVPAGILLQTNSSCRII